MHDISEIVGGLGAWAEIAARTPLPELTAAVEAACSRAEDSGTPAVVVLWLPGSTDDDRSWPGEVGIRDVSRWERALRRLERSAAVTIAVAAGTCAGPALDVLLTTDYRIAMVGFELMLPVNDGHFWPGMAMYRLTNQLGGAQARKVVLWGDQLGVERAKNIGLIDEVAVNVNEAAQAAAVLLGRAAGSELAVRRQLVLEAPSTSYEDALGAHLAASDRELRRIQGATGDGSDVHSGE